MQNKMDFTLSAYKQLISALQSQGFIFQTFEEYIQNSKEKVVILRHDVDRKPGNSLVTAKIEKNAGIRASYYFRIVKESYDESIIKQIAEMGHEVGYHYENLSEISRKKEVAPVEHPGREPGSTGQGGQKTEDRNGSNRMAGWKQLNMERGG